MRVEPAGLGRIKFSWKLPDLIQYADMSLREFDDSPVRVVLAFEGDRSKFSGKNAMLSELAHVLTGEPLPYATLMYVWCNSCEPGTVILNPHTDRSDERRQWYQAPTRQPVHDETDDEIQRVEVQDHRDQTKR